MKNCDYLLHLFILNLLLFLFSCGEDVPEPEVAQPFTYKATIKTTIVYDQCPNQNFESTVKNVLNNRNQIIAQIPIGTSTIFNAETANDCSKFHTFEYGNLNLPEIVAINSILERYFYSVPQHQTLSFSSIQYSYRTTYEPKAVYTIEKINDSYATYAQIVQHESSDDISYLLENAQLINLDTTQDAVMSEYFDIDFFKIISIQTQELELTLTSAQDNISLLVLDQNLEYLTSGLILSEMTDSGKIIKTQKINAVANQFIYLRIIDTNLFFDENRVTGKRSNYRINNSIYPYNYQITVKK